VGGADELGRDRVRLDEVNWLGWALEAGARCDVQLRYRSRAVPATVLSVGADTIELGLDQAARAVAPGQSGVLYGEEARVLGGGLIG
jgi:tRNA-specific 2-thiouridylase